MTPSFASLVKQWRRSNWLGVIRRARDYVYGAECYMVHLHGKHTPGIEPYYESQTPCSGRMRLIEQLPLGGTYRENWQCDVCGATLGEVF